MTRIDSVLAIGAHPDDIELGCGGSLAKLAAQGAQVHALVLTRGERGNEGAHDRGAETRQALRVLGVRHIEQAEFSDTRLAESLPELVAAIEAACDRFEPQRVYTMFREDRHQDHRAVYEASIVACRRTPQVLCYETPSAWPNFVPQVYEDISGFLGRKVEAIQCHLSQKGRSYTQEDQIRTLAQFRGQQVAGAASEGFIPYKLIL